MAGAPAPDANTNASASTVVLFFNDGPSSRCNTISDGGHWRLRIIPAQ